MHTNDDFSRLHPVIQRAKSKWGIGDDPGTIVADVLKAFKAEGIQMTAPVDFQPLGTYISGSLHRATFPRQTQVLLVGPTNGGKDLFTKNCLNKDVASQIGVVKLPSGKTVNIIDDVDIADQTRAVTRVAFGKGDLELFNTPGLYSDDPELEAMTRVTLGLETDVSEIGYIDSARTPAEYQRLGTDEIPIDLDKAIVIYLVNLKLTPFRPFSELIQQDLQGIYESTGDRLFVVGSFLDEFNTWDPDAQKRRREEWHSILPQDIRLVEYSGRTGEGLPLVIHQFLRASNLDPSYVLPYLKAERKASRLGFALHSLSVLLANLVCGTLERRCPYSDLIAAITLTSALHLSLHYSVSEANWFKHNGEITRIVQDGLAKETVTQRRNPRGWEHLIRWWPGKSFSEDVDVYQITIRGLGEVLEFLYKLIYELEGVSSAVVSNAEEWFTTEMEKVAGKAFSKKETAKVARLLSDVLLKFWQVHHPESLDLTNRLGLNVNDKGGK